MRRDRGLTSTDTAAATPSKAVAFPPDTTQHSGGTTRRAVVQFPLCAAAEKMLNESVHVNYVQIIARGGFGRGKYFFFSF